MKLNEFKGKYCKLLIKFEGKILFYRANVLDVTKEHIVFRDTFGRLYGYHVSLIREINEINPAKEAENDHQKKER